MRVMYTIDLMVVTFVISVVYIPILVKAIKDNARETAERIEQMKEEVKAQLEEDKK